MDFGGISAEVLYLAGSDTDPAFYMDWVIRAGDVVPLLIQVTKDDVPVDLTGSTYHLLMDWGLGMVELISGISSEVLVLDQTVLATRGMVGLALTEVRLDTLPLDTPFHYQVRRTTGSVKKTLLYGRCTLFKWVGNA